MSGSLMIAFPASAGVPIDPEPELATTTSVQFLGTNDFHGRILPDFDSGEAGAAVMAGAVKQLQGPYTNTVFGAAGDLIGASSFESSVAGDKPTIDVLNSMGLDVSAVGNHEFDQGYDDLVNRVMNEDATDGGATWEYLGANVRIEEDGSAALPETWLATFDNATPDDTADDVSIGFVGVVTDSTPSLVSPAGIEGLEFEKEAVAANRSAAMLEDEGADAIVLLVHEGAPTTDYADAVDPSNDFGEMISELDDSIDAVMSGHTHLEYNHEVPVATWAGRDFGRPVVSSGQYGMNLNELVFEFDNVTDELIGIDSSVIDIAETEQVDPGCTGTEEEPCETTPVFPADAEVQALVDAAEEASEELGARTIGELTDPLYRARTEGGSFGSTRGAESTLGNAIADVHLWATEANGAEIAFMNPGGLRADLLGTAGGTGDYPTDVSFRQAYDVQPFGNTLSTMDLTGSQIAELLEEQWQPAGSSRPFLRLGVSEGFEYTYDATAEPGDRIVQMWLNDEPIDLDEVYTVATNSFLASGGDNFSTFTEGADVQDTARVDRDIMVSYMEANDALGTDYGQRAIGLQADTLEVAAGDEISFDLTSLMFTAPTDLVDETVTVSLGRGELGTFPVTNELPTDILDEHGTASVTVTIPAGVSGDVVLWVEGDTTGTRFPIAITVMGDGFSDVNGNEHAAAIEWLASEGITQGWPDGTFRPFHNATRDAVATFLYRIEGSPEFTPTGQTFPDVPSSLEHYASVEWLASEGITQGYSDGTFRPFGNITRDAFVAYLYRLEGEPAVSAEAGFPDVNSEMEHADAIAWAAEVGVTEGWDDGTFRPFEPITRDAIAAMLFRYDALPQQS
ncbi:5'-nucleotidase C-terminal domain-containing protein [Demequina sp. SO4-13]|uniref:5'-nucleotidase C-terminal domain-containing protein n=1 Tax=Demequina sp. SO4-13 TaxID=3401027 RepID=UPI003AF669F2